MNEVMFGGKPKTHTYEEFVADVERRRAELAAESKEASEKSTDPRVKELKDIENGKWYEFDDA